MPIPNSNPKSWLSRLGFTLTMTQPNISNHGKSSYTYKPSEAGSNRRSTNIGCCIEIK